MQLLISGSLKLCVPGDYRHHLQGFVETFVSFSNVPHVATVLCYLKELLASMPLRCEAVIEANGMHTKY